VLGKSCKMVPVMLFGILIGGKYSQYKLSDYVQVGHCLFFGVFVCASTALDPCSLSRALSNLSAPDPSSAALGFTNYSQVSMLGVRYESVNFGSGKSPGSPNWRAHTH
jgi:hypothetical protein